MKPQSVTLDEPLELMPGALYRLGARVPTRGRLSWVPPDVVEPLPLNVYVLLSAEHALVLDTGPQALYPKLAEQIRALQGERDLAVMVTRNDPEAMGGVGTLLPQLTPTIFYYYGGGSILEWVWDDRDGPGASGDLFDTVPVDSPAQIALGPDRSIQIIRPPLAVLNTVWAYDPASKTLFTSDGFGYVPEVSDLQPHDGSILDERADIDGPRAKAFLNARFDWISRINSARLTEELRALFAPLDIENLAPSHGVVVRGAAAVSRYLRVALRELEPAPVRTV